jgi:hypothetical protein
MKTELEQLGREAREVLVAPPVEGVPKAFLDRADGTTRRRRGRVAAVTTVLVLLFVAAGLSQRREPASIVDAPPTEPSGGRPVVLADGTVIETGPLSDVRIDTSGTSTSVVLTQGHVDIRAPKTAATTVKLGRWTVHVTSSAHFAADTSHVDGTLVVLEGSVELRDGEVRKSLSAGARFDLFAVEAPKPVEGAPTAPVDSSSLERHSAKKTVVSSAKPTPETPRIPVLPTPAAEPSRWSEWVAAGRATAVLEEALPRLQEVLREQSAPVLLALADAARFEHRDEVAEQTCETIRRRFPKTAHAATARFIQGRLAEHRGALTQALAHYEAYDVEAPEGALAAEALARRVQLESARSDGRACGLAKAYIERFPAGPLAEAFRQRCLL